MNTIEWQAVDLREVRVNINRIVMALSIGAVLQVSAAGAGQPVAPGAGAGGQGGPTGQGGQAAARNQPPPVQVISRRPPAAVLGTIRGGAADGTIWFGWPVSMPSTAIAGTTLSDVLAIADGLGVPGVEASSTQRTAFEAPKPFDARLQAGERNALVTRLRELRQLISVYRVDDLGADAAARRRTFELAKAVEAPLIVTRAGTPGAASLAELDTLATEFEVKVAIETAPPATELLKALAGRSARLGAAVDLGTWMQRGAKAADALAFKDRLLLVRVEDRSALGAAGTPVALGEGAGGLADFFLGVYTAGIKPLNIVIESLGTTEGDLARNLAAFERVMWPAMAARVRDMVKSPAGQIRDGSRLDADMQRQIAAAVPDGPLARPRKPRKLLVTDLQMYLGHSSIPHGNLLLKLMGEKTGAFEAVFSNDLDLLKYPAIKQFDAVYFNNVCGMVHNDPAVRESLLRYVREGGGIGGHHAVTYANNNWPEFSEMMGGWAGQHHTETQVLKIDDPSSPLMKSFGAGPIEHTDEFYVFPMLLALFARQAARAHEHRRRQIRSRDGEPLLRGLHAHRSGLRRRVDQGIRQGPRLLHAARPYEHLLHRSPLDDAPARGDSIHPRRPRRRRHARRGAARVVARLIETGSGPHPRSEGTIRMPKIRRRSVAARLSPAAGFALLLLLLLSACQTAPERRPYTTWSDYAGTADSMQYSALAQVNTANVKTLDLAWTIPRPVPAGGSPSGRSSSTM